MDKETFNKIISEFNNEISIESQRKISKELADSTQEFFNKHKNDNLMSEETIYEFITDSAFNISKSVVNVNNKRLINLLKELLVENDNQNE